MEGEAPSESFKSGERMRGGAGERGKEPQMTEQGFLIYDLFFHRFLPLFLREKKRRNKVGSSAFRRSGFL